MSDKTTRDISSTIYDDVFRTLLEKTPRLFIYLVNEVFSENYSSNAELILLQNELMSDDKLITDSYFTIGDKQYHIECQSNPDGTMAIRMIEYDFRIALRHAQKQGYEYNISYPKSCVLYLRHNENTPDSLMVHVTFPDGRVTDYKTPIIKVQNYSLQEIFDKKLFVFLPYYMMRYEKELSKSVKTIAERDKLLQECESIYLQIRKLSKADMTAFEENELSDCVEQVFSWIARAEQLLVKEVNTMKGKVLHTRTDEIYEAGIKNGQFDATVAHVTAMMEHWHIGLAEAMNILKVPDAVRDSISQAMQK